ncbi:MAG: Crp/Fnr family transcriptional regulator [Desulfovibrio sp.]|jgi:CRP-like cAMP-binding protein|nr:Crp/Fnr family transcriptional regulator [Desulfovibrio sp.]
MKIHQEAENKGIPGRGIAFREMKEINSPWRSVLYLARRFTLTRGQKIPLGGELFFLERGRVRLTHQSLEGKEKILWYVNQGCVLGESPFFNPIQSESFFICASNCVVYAFSREDVRRIIRERADLLGNLLRSMSRKMYILSRHAVSLQLDSGLQRICKFLAQRVVPGSTPMTACFDISRQRMADLLGMHRVSLYKLLRQQEANGLFGPISGRKVQILQPKKFYILAGIRNLHDNG